MAMMTMIARTVDGLPLVGTMQENEEVSTGRSSHWMFQISQLSNWISVGKKCFGVSKSGKNAV
jgi:hypothetical protein